MWDVNTSYGSDENSNFVEATLLPVTAANGPATPVAKVWKGSYPGWVLGQTIAGDASAWTTWSGNPPVASPTPMFEPAGLVSINVVGHLRDGTPIVNALSSEPGSTQVGAAITEFGLRPLANPYGSYHVVDNVQLGLDMGPGRITGTDTGTGSALAWYPDGYGSILVFAPALARAEAGGATGFINVTQGQYAAGGLVMGDGATRPAVFVQAIGEGFDDFYAVALPTSGASGFVLEIGADTAVGVTDLGGNNYVYTAWTLTPGTNRRIAANWTEHLLAPAGQPDFGTLTMRLVGQNPRVRGSTSAADSSPRPCTSRRPPAASRPLRLPISARWPMTHACCATAGC